MKYARLIIAVICTIAGVSLLFVHTDRLTLHLIPTPGATNAVTLEANKEYRFDFTANLPGITRFGLYLAPANRSVPPTDISLEIYRGSTQIGQALLSTEFLDQERAFEWRFPKALPTDAREALSAKLTIPPELTGLLRLKVRQPDDTFNARDTTFFIDNEVQSAPLAYEAYTTYTPPLAVQVGSLLVLTSLYCAAMLSIRLPKEPVMFALLSVALSVVALTPTLLLGGKPYILIITQAISWYGMFLVMRRRHHSIAASVTSANIFAFTTWFSLQLSAEYFSYMAVAALPYIFLLVQSPRISLSKKWSVATLMLVLLTGVALTSIDRDRQLPVHPANVRDVFLDPNQLPTAVKTADTAAWDNFGSYIGLIAAILVVIGICAPPRHIALPITLGIVLVVVLATPLYTLGILAKLGISPAHLSIALTYLAALLAGRGIDVLRTFLDPHHRLVDVYALTITILVLLDLWQVLVPVLELPYLV